MFVGDGNAKGSEIELWGIEMRFNAEDVYIMTGILEVCIKGAAKGDAGLNIICPWALLVLGTRLKVSCGGR